MTDHDDEVISAFESEVAGGMASGELSMLHPVFDDIHRTFDEIHRTADDILLVLDLAIAEKKARQRRGSD